MKKNLIAVLMVWAVFGVRAAEGDNVYSSNIHAIVKVETRSANVLLAVPWTGYTPTGSSDVELLVDHLVSPKGLTDGDLLLVVGGQHIYDSWMLKVEDGAGHWEPTTNVAKAQEFAKNIVYQTNADETIVRGLGLWLIRQNPKDGEVWKPVYLYGQYATGGQVVTVERTDGDMESILVAHPTCREIALNDKNDVTWTNVASDDILSIPNGTDAPDYAHWNGTQWYILKPVRTARGIKNTQVTDIKVPAGQGFWYSRRAEGAVTITFE